MILNMLPNYLTGASVRFGSEMVIIYLCFVFNKKIDTFMTYSLLIHNNWFARQQPRGII